jgi:hypothetical protein
MFFPDLTFVFVRFARLLSHLIDGLFGKCPWTSDKGINLLLDAFPDANCPPIV